MQVAGSSRRPNSGKFATLLYSSSSRCAMRFCLPLNFAGGVFAAVYVLLCLGTAQAEIVPFTMVDAALFPGAPPASIVVPTGQQLPGGVNNTAAGNEFNISYLFFDID